jgi:MtfA peptidase
VFQRWQAHWRQRREAAAVRRRTIPDDLWKRVLVRYPFLQRRNPADGLEIRRLTSLFLDRKEFNAAGGLKLTDAMAVAIAAQAVLPVLRLGLQRYDGFLGLVVHPDQVLATREVEDHDGVVHVYEEPLSGEAMQGGPIMLSWRDVRGSGFRRGDGESSGPAYNVVIHEFAHVLDMEDGLADGVPLLPSDLPRAEWQATLSAAYFGFVQTVEAGETGEAGEAGEANTIDPYGAESPEEFFAVASEAFFVSPQAFRAEMPALHALFVRFYAQDPALDLPAPRRSG